MPTLPNTSQQINTLLTQLEHHAFKHPILFAKPLSQIAFDYTPDSIARLNQLLTQLAKKDYTLDSLLQQQGGTNFFLSIAGYLANYLAKSTDEPVVWLNYTEALTEINKKNRQYGTDFSLDKDFDNSLVAKIGDGMFCRPLQAVRATLAGEGDITGFIAEMQTSIFDRAFVDVADSPDTACQRYLAKIRTGKLKDTTIAFFDDIKHIDFDYSEKSLHAIDTALAHICQTHGLSENQYLEKINDPAIQALCYLLGFYLGVTTGKLTQRPVHWASFSQAKAMLGTPISHSFEHSLEHSIVLISENHYHTPMLAISNTLFTFTDYPCPSEFVQKFMQDSQAEFAHPTADTLQWFAFNRENSDLSTEKMTAIPKSWQMAMNLAGRLLAHDLLAIFDGGELSPNLYELNVETKQANVRTLGENSPNINQATHVKHIETLYETLKTNPNNLPLLVASFASQLTLTTGKIPAIVVEIRVYQEPKLALQLMLPYRPANSEAGFAIFPIAYHSQNALAKRQPQAYKILTARLPQLVDMLYLATQKVPSPMHTGSFWDNYYLPISLENTTNVGLNLSHSQEKSSLQQREEYTPAEQISLSLLEPIAVSYESIAIENDEFKQHPSLQNQAIQDTNLPTAILQKPDLQNQELPNQNKQTTLVQEPLLQELTFQDHFSQTPASQTFAVQNSSSQIPSSQIPISQIAGTQNLTSQNPVFQNSQRQDLIPKERILENTLSQNQVNRIATEMKTPDVKTETKTDAKTKAELIEKLRQDQARLQTELSTSDESKDKKLIYIGVAVVVVILLMLLMSKLMK